MKKFNFFSGIISIFATVVSIFVSLISRLDYQELLLWKSVDFIIFSWFVNITFFSIIHIILGSLIFYTTLYQCIEIIKINNQAHEAKNQPKILLDNGYYEKVRHPMTAKFFTIILSFFFMLCSFIGIPLIVLFAFVFTVITLYEEKKILIPTFGEKYMEYMKKVKYRFFTFKMKLIVLLLIIFLIFGVVLI